MRLAAGPAAALIILLLAGPGRDAAASDVTCSTGGDAAGWTVAGGGDFDGDGIADVAIGSPCANVGLLNEAGRVVVRAGGSGKHLLTVKGTTAGQRLGGAVAFAGDISGDGRDDLLLGSPGWTVTMPDTTVRVRAGKAEVVARDGNIILTVEGSFGQGNLGEALAGLSDVDDDAVPDFVVGAGNDRQVTGGDRLGAVYLVSGATGVIVDASFGDVAADQWGAVLSSAGDVNDDGIEDILASSNSADLQVSDTVRQENNGLARILSGADLGQVLVQAYGRQEDKLGKASCTMGDVDGDGVPDFATGSPGVTVSVNGNAGAAAIHSGKTGAVMRTFTEPVPTPGAAFGTAVANVGRIDSDAKSDLVIAAENAVVDGLIQVGRIHLFSSSGGAPLWTVAGSVPGARVGHSLAAGPDWNGDGYTDVLVGSPGDAFRGRRGAGTVQVISGVDGARLARFGGRIGLETRLFVAGWNLDEEPQAVSLDTGGRRKEVRADVLRGLRAGGLSAAVLDDYIGAAADSLQMAIGTGHGGDAPIVEVIRAGRRRGSFPTPSSTLTRLTIDFSRPYSGGVSVGAGKLTTDMGDELAVAQADSTNGDVEVSVYKRFDKDPAGKIWWGRATTFAVFQADTSIQGFLVGATGATVSVDAVIATSSCDAGTDAGKTCSTNADCAQPSVCLAGPDNIVVGSVSGAPAVRVFHVAGTLKAEWLAYPPQTHSGVLVSTGNLDNSGPAEIVTVPASGPLRVRAFSGDGKAYVSPVTGAVVDFLVSQANAGAAVTKRVGVAIADVDLDGRGEILIAGADPGKASQVVAFELDGAPVAGWSPVRPFGPAAVRSFALAATDRYVRQR